MCVTVEEICGGDNGGAEWGASLWGDLHLHITVSRSMEDNGVGERRESMMSSFDASQCKSLSLQSANLSKKGHKAHL